MKDAIDKLLNNLLARQNISLEMISKYYNTHEDLIDTLENIFLLRSSRDAALVMTIADILYDEKKACEIQDFFMKEQKENSIVAEAERKDDDILKLLTAFVYNRRFFARALNWSSIAFAMARNYSCGTWKEETKILYRAASTDGFNSFGKISLGEIGTIDICGCESEEKILFEFRPKQITRPFRMSIAYTVLADGKKFITEIKDNEKREKQILISSVLDADFKQGIQIDNIKWGSLKENL